MARLLQTVIRVNFRGLFLFLLAGEFLKLLHAFSILASRLPRVEYEYGLHVGHLILHQEGRQYCQRECSQIIHRLSLPSLLNWQLAKGQVASERNDERPDSAHQYDSDLVRKSLPEVQAEHEPKHLHAEGENFVFLKLHQMHGLVDRKPEKHGGEDWRQVVDAHPLSKVGPRHSNQK